LRFLTLISMRVGAVMFQSDSGYNIVDYLKDKSQ
jgi:hypothetical protein